MIGFETISINSRELQPQWRFRNISRHTRSLVSTYKPSSSNVSPVSRQVIKLTPSPNCIIPDSSLARIPGQIRSLCGRNGRKGAELSAKLQSLGANFLAIRTTTAKFNDRDCPVKWTCFEAPGFRWNFDEHRWTCNLTRVIHNKHTGRSTKLL